jgi:hypothetical protein
VDGGFPPDAAWQLAVFGGPNCAVGTVADSFGTVTTETIVHRELDGSAVAGEQGETALVKCSVVGPDNRIGPYNVNAIGGTQSGSKTLGISIPAFFANGEAAQGSIALTLLAIARKRGKMVKTFGQGLGTRAGGGPRSSLPRKAKEG